MKKLLFTVYEDNQGIIIEVITNNGITVPIPKPTVSIQQFEETLKFIGDLIPKG